MFAKVLPKSGVLMTLICSLLTFICYAKTLRSPLLTDDLTISYQVKLAGPFGMWTMPGQAVFRPFVAFVFWLMGHFVGLLPWPWHLHNMVLLFLTSLLIRAFVVELSRLGRPVVPLFWTRVANLSAVLFVIWPAHTEVVNWICCMTDGYSTLFGMAALFMVIRFWRTNDFKCLVASSFAYILALLCKEQPICLMLIAPLIAYISPVPLIRKFQGVGAIFSGFAAYAVAKLLIFHSLTGSYQYANDKGNIGENFIVKLYQNFLPFGGYLAGFIGRQQLISTTWTLVGAAFWTALALATFARAKQLTLEEGRRAVARVLLVSALWLFTLLVYQLACMVNADIVEGWSGRITLPVILISVMSYRLSVTKLRADGKLAYLGWTALVLAFFALWSLSCYTSIVPVDWAGGMRMTTKLASAINGCAPRFLFPFMLLYVAIVALCQYSGTRRIVTRVGEAAGAYVSILRIVGTLFVSSLVAMLPTIATTNRFVGWLRFSYEPTTFSVIVVASVLVALVHFLRGVGWTGAGGLITLCLLSVARTNEIWANTAYATEATFGQIGRLCARYRMVYVLSLAADVDGNPASFPGLEPYLALHGEPARDAIATYVDFQPGDRIIARRVSACSFSLESVGTVRRRAYPLEISQTGRDVEDCFSITQSADRKQALVVIKGFDPKRDRVVYFDGENTLCL